MTAQQRPKLVNGAREMLLARWAKYSDPKNLDWEFEDADRWERHAINALLDLVAREEADALSAHNTAQLIAALEAKEKELVHFRELQNVDPYQYAPGNCCGDAHMSLQFALEAIKEIGFEVETREGENLTEIIWHNKRAETAEAELERLRSQGAGQWEAAAREAAKEIKTSPTGHMTCRLSEGHIFDIILKHFAGLASPPEGLP